MEETLNKSLENKGLYYGPNVKEVIKLISRTQGKVDLESEVVFGKQIHGFIWAFFTGLSEGKKESKVDWVSRDGFSLGTINRDGAETVADVMIMVALNEYEITDIETDFTKNNSQREILNIISSYAEGGAKHILEIREGNDLNSKTFLNNVDDFFDEITKRLK